MIDLIPAQAADRITALLTAHESRMLDFKRISVMHDVCRHPRRTDGH